MDKDGKIVPYAFTRRQPGATDVTIQIAYVSTLDRSRSYSSCEPRLVPCLYTHFSAPIPRLLRVSL